MRDLSNAALLVVDVQQGFDDPSWGRRNNPDCESNIARLVEGWEGPIVLVRHDSVTPGSPLRPELPGNALRSFLPDDPNLFITKSVNSAFYGDPDLHAWLTEQAIETLVVCGVTTNHCCETTTRMAGNLGYETYFVLDATHTFDTVGPDGVVVPAEDLARATAASLHEEFATVVMTNDVV